MDDKIFEFVYTYSKTMGFLEEMEWNVLNINQPVVVRNGETKRVTLTVLSDLYDIVEELYDELDDNIRVHYEVKMGILKTRVSIAMRLETIGSYVV